MAKSVAKRLLPWLRTVGGVLLLRWLGARLLTALFGKSGRFPQALEAYETAARINPGYAQNLFNMGKVHQDLGHAQEAVDSFQRAVDAQPAYFEAYASLGGALTPMRRWKQAAEILTDALLLQPRSPEALYLLAFALMHICQVCCATCACMQAGRQAGRHTDMHACVH